MTTFHLALFVLPAALLAGVVALAVWQGRRDRRRSASGAARRGAGDRR